MKQLRGSHDARKAGYLTIVDRPWYKKTIAILGIPATLAATATACLALWNLGPFSQNPVDVNVVFVADASAQSLAPFDGTTKGAALSIAMDTALQSVADEDNIAFLTYGGDCSGQTSRDVAFRTGNKEKVREALRTLVFQGQRTLVQGFVDATE